MSVSDNCFDFAVDWLCLRWWVNILVWMVDDYSTLLVLSCCLLFLNGCLVLVGVLVVCCWLRLSVVGWLCVC